MNKIKNSNARAELFCFLMSKSDLLVNLRNRTGEEGRRRTFCDKRDNNFVLKNFFSTLHFPLNRSFC